MAAGPDLMSQIRRFRRKCDAAYRVMDVNAPNGCSRAPVPDVGRCDGAISRGVVAGSRPAMKTKSSAGINALERRRAPWRSTPSVRSFRRGG
jgi:hypothetical protein